MIDILLSPYSVFLLSALVVAYSGTQLSHDANQLADRTGMGEALFGMVFLGGVTSLAGIITSASAAYAGAADLAFSNAVGGILVQTVCLAIADVCLPGVNLEHAAASIENLFHGLLLVILLALLACIMAGPILLLGHIHIGSFVILLAYFFSMRIIRSSKHKATWKAIQTPETAENISLYDPEEATTEIIWVTFIVHIVLIILAGYFVAQSALTIMEETSLSGTLIGFGLTGLATSLPELVTSIAAIRERALNLAVGSIVGGNAFEILILPVSDAVFQNGSLYHALSSIHLFLIAVAILMNAVLVFGLLRRQKQGPGNIGFESFTLFFLYLITLLVVSAQ